MIEEQAQVIGIDGDTLLLQANTQSACGSCSAQKGCGTSVLSKVVGRKFSRFHAINNVGAEVGDTVIVGIAEDALIKGSLMMYILPLMSMFLFAVLADLNLAASYQGRELMIIGIALAGLTTGSLLARWYFKRNSSARLFSPVVLRKIIEHGKL
jgi:sigma-E factor negative regulatory protein RseC